MIEIAPSILSADFCRLGDQIAGLTLKQAKSLSDYLKDEYGIEPAAGGGVVGASAAKVACGLGAKVHLLDVNLDRLRYLNDVMPANCIPLMSSPAILRLSVTTWLA